MEMGWNFEPRLKVNPEGAGGAAEWEWSQTKSKVVSVGYKYK